MCSENFIRPVKFNNWFNHQIRSRFDQQFVYECVEIVQPVRVQEAMEVQWSMTKSQLGLEIPIIGLPTKCAQSDKRFFCKYTKPWNQSETIKPYEFGWAFLKSY